MSNNYWDSVRVSSVNVHGVKTVRIIRNEQYHWLDIVLYSENGIETRVNVYSDATNTLPEMTLETVAAPAVAEPVPAPEPVAA